MSNMLIVDDEDEFREFINDYFEIRGYDIRQADNGLDGVKLATENRPDIVMLDMKMPGIHGDEVLKQLLEMYPGIKVIMVTASEGFGKTRERLLQMGAFACFDKPIESLKVVEEKVKEAIAS